MVTRGPSCRCIPKNAPKDYDWEIVFSTVVPLLFRDKINFKYTNTNISKVNSKLTKKIESIFDYLVISGLFSIFLQFRSYY